MQLAMCNEFCVGWEIDRVFELAASAGYQGVELAPFTLAASVGDITPDQRRQIVQAARGAGVRIAGLHWLLAKTSGLHVSCPDDATRRRAADYLKSLIDLCAQLGSDRMVFGSPMQRSVAAGDTHDAAHARMVELFQQIAPHAGQANVRLCIEPLSRDQTNLLNTADQAVRFIEAVGHPAVGLILDCLALSDEGEALPAIIKRSAQHLAHFHANDTTRGYPGTGTLDFAAILQALRDIDYRDWVSIEVFDFNPPPEQIAREGLAHLRNALQAIRVPGPTDSRPQAQR